MAERTTADEDRRRSPRFNCGGHAIVSPLPSNGIFIPGKVVDLSLHGCRIDTHRPIDCGVRAEIVVRVNSASFRAVGEVRVIRGRSGAGMEFVRLSAGGKNMLAGLVTELARLQAIGNKLKSARREMDAESFRRQLEEGELQAAMLSGRFSLLGTTLRAESSGESSGKSSGESSETDEAAFARKDGVVETQPLVIRVDLFG